MQVLISLAASPSPPGCHEAIRALMTASQAERGYSC